ncbi:family 43 glycosylhydrolase [Caulobacter hibisci]|uniref:Family 43 glycosylhydrolase n=2 Tax=Caulobacter hibisci TaxID=2035993 RepID=A0ABS0SZI1_9CAUL|nr:family 43 glycosylhydrolase [Caulobacter hibisci]MBI1685047.1 family 43 glycosylhydrolase [Caulobacter hibisci]
MLAGAGALTVGGYASIAEASSATEAAPLINPVVRQRADAQVFKHTDGYYYLTGSVPEYDRLIIRRSRSLAGFTTADETVIWRRPTQGKLGGYIWAPELHWFDDAWHMYFAAGDKDQPFRIRTYALRCDGPDALTGKWSLLGKVETPWDTFTLDSTSFVHKGVRYFCWAQKEPGIDTNSNLYLAPLATPTTLAKPPVRLTVPTLDWEIRGFKVAEAAAPLIRNGKVFIAYSASATDDRYCLGLLTADAEADLMSQASWSKSPVPVFVSSEETRVWGPGHNSFTVDEQGRDVLVFHGRDYKAIKGDPLFDPNRHTRVQRLYYKPDGTPDFGVPAGAGEIPDRFSPLDRPGAFLRYEGAGLSVGDGPLATTQLRQKAGPAGQVTLEPILQPGHAVRVVGGKATIGEAKPGDKAALFKRVKGLADAKGVSFQALDGGYLLHRDGAVVVGPAKDAKARAAATFLVS